MTEITIQFKARTNLAITNDDLFALRQAIEDSAPLGPNGVFEIVYLELTNRRVLRKKGELKMLQEGITEGRIVHYAREDGFCEAAIITRARNTGNNIVSLRTFAVTAPAQDECHETVDYFFDTASRKAAGTWHWLLDHELD